MKPITLRELANELGENRSQLRKWVIKYFGKGSLELARDPVGGGQSVLVVKETMIDRIRQERINWNGESCKASSLIETAGYFYAIQTCPDISQKRFKFGYAVDVDHRSATHRTTCPTLCVLKTWKCESFVEKTALLVVAKHSVHVGGEVFDVDDWLLMEQYLDSFFQMFS